MRKSGPELPFSLYYHWREHYNCTTAVIVCMSSASLSSNDLAHLGLKEMVRCCWLDIKGLGLISMLSVRCMRLSASDGHFWRVAVRSMFPLHPFEVNVDGKRCAIFLVVRIGTPACLSWTVYECMSLTSIFFLTSYRHRFCI